LPQNVAGEVRSFFEFNISWLKDIYTQLRGRDPLRQAQSALAALEGAMIVATVNENPDIFEAVAERILP